MDGRRSLPTLTLGVLLLASAPTAWAKKPPAWLTALARMPTPAVAGDADAVVLLREQVLTVESGSRLTRRGRLAIKVLTEEGRDEAALFVPYLRDVVSAFELEAWVIGHGEPVRLREKDAVDVSVSSGLHDEAGVRTVSGSAHAREGEIFGAEWQTVESSIFTQEEWTAHESLPVHRARLELRVPAGWTVTAERLGGSGPDPWTSGAGVWEARDLRPIEDEPWGPRRSRLEPRLGVTWHSPPESSAPSFAAWTEVAAWLQSLNDPAAKPNEAVAARATALVAGEKDRWPRLEALARFAQQLRYVSVDLGAGRGGGYRPSPADDVLARSWGDCKDKVALLRALLSSVGIASHSVHVFSGDAGRVERAWPSPQQFNHCIVAVPVGEEVEARAIVEHPDHGRLLVFDPTASHTPLGELPASIQGGLALVSSRGTGDLVRLPLTPASERRQVRAVTAEVDGAHAFRVRLRERSSGPVAAVERGLRASLREEDYARRLAEHFAGGASLEVIEVQDRAAPDEFALELAFTADRSVRALGGGLLTVPTALVPLAPTPPPCDGRRQPIHVAGAERREVVEVRLPEGFGTDALPDEIELREGFGRFRSRCEDAPSGFRCERVLSLDDATLGPEGCETVRSFLVRARQAEESVALVAGGLGD